LNDYGSLSLSQFADGFFLISWIGARDQGKEKKVSVWVPVEGAEVSVFPPLQKFDAASISRAQQKPPHTLRAPRDILFIGTPLVATHNTTNRKSTNIIFLFVF